MRESKTIRRTFPGTVDSPGTKERISEVASNSEQVTRRSDGLGGVVKKEPEPVSPVGGVPKPVKKTFAEQVSSAEMKQRLKGAAVTGVNVSQSRRRSCGSQGVAEDGARSRQTRQCWRPEPRRLD